MPSYNSAEISFYLSDYQNLFQLMLTAADVQRNRISEALECPHMTPLDRSDLYVVFREMSLQEDKASDYFNHPTPNPKSSSSLRLFSGIISFRKPSRVWHLKLGLAHPIISCASPHLWTCTAFHMRLLRDCPPLIDRDHHESFDCSG